MQHGDSGAVFASDAELVRQARAGERSAFGLLYLRHGDAAWRIACISSGFSADAELALIEGFTAVLSALPREPEGSSFPSYLLACVRLAALRRASRCGRVHPPAAPGGVDLRSVAPIAVEALRALPELARSALWIIEVEAVAPTEASAILGVAPEAVRGFAEEAADRLRQACWGAQQASAAPGCRATVERLGPYVRDRLPPAERLGVEAHLNGCLSCRMRRSELVAPQAVLLAALPPLPLLGGECQRHWQRRAARAAGTRRHRSPARAAELALAATGGRHPTLARLSLPSAAVLAVAVGSLIVALPPLRSPRAPSYQAAVAPSQVTPAPPAPRQESFDFPQTTQVPLGLPPAGQPAALTFAMAPPATGPSPLAATATTHSPPPSFSLPVPSSAAASPPATPSGLAVTQPFPTRPEPTAAEAAKGGKHRIPDTTNTAPAHDRQDRQGREQKLTKDHSANPVQV